MPGSGHILFDTKMRLNNVSAAASLSCVLLKLQEVCVTIKTGRVTQYKIKKSRKKR